MLYLYSLIWDMQFDFIDFWGILLWMYKINFSYIPCMYMCNTGNYTGTVALVYGCGRDTWVQYNYM